MDELMKVENLQVSYRSSKKSTEVLKDLNFSLPKGKTLVIVGESGSGKSTLGKALSGLLPPSTFISGKLKFEKEEYDLSDPNFQWQKIRGKKIGHIFQDPQSSFNPRKKIKRQFYETLVLSHNKTWEESKRKAEELLKLLNFKDIDQVLEAFPYQLSGGMCQRVSIALSLALEPDLIIADEITSALDLKSQSELIRLMDRIKKEFNAGIIFITHDLYLAKKIGDRILFLNDGVLEDGNKYHAMTEILKENKEVVEENTKNLLVEVKDLSKDYSGHEVLKELSFSIQEGEVFGVLGESGCGKSTLARLLSGIESEYTGTIVFKGKDLKEKVKEEGRFFYKDIQIIFQDERGCLNPYEEIRSIVGESIKNLRPATEDVLALSKKSLEAVGLNKSLYQRRSGNLSTGQCQRVSIARAIAVEPKLLILDEVVSALDRSIKIQIIELLKELQKESNVTMLMISHEIDVLQSTCQRIAMMKDGKVQEIIPVNHESMRKMKCFLMEA